MFTSLLVDTCIGLPEPCMGSLQCMYQSNAYIDMSVPVIH